jgi:hypothetical protein
MEAIRDSEWASKALVRMDDAAYQRVPTHTQQRAPDSEEAKTNAAIGLCRSAGSWSVAPFRRQWNPPAPYLRTHDLHMHLLVAHGRQCQRKPMDEPGAAGAYEKTSVPSWVIGEAKARSTVQGYWNRTAPENGCKPVGSGVTINDRAQRHTRITRESIELEQSVRLCLCRVIQGSAQQRFNVHRPQSGQRRLVDAAKDNQWLLPSGVAPLLSVHASRQQYPTPSRTTIAANAGSSARNFLRIFLTSALTFTR